MFVCLFFKCLKGRERKKEKSQSLESNKERVRVVLSLLSNGRNIAIVYKLVSLLRSLGYKEKITFLITLVARSISLTVTESTQ